MTMKQMETTIIMAHNLQQKPHPQIISEEKPTRLSEKSLGNRFKKSYNVRAVLLVAVLGVALAAPAAAQTNSGIAPLDPASCSDGTYVSDPTVNTGLVSDCQTLVTIRNHWTNDSLNASLPADHILRSWSGNITTWDGITVGSTPKRVTHVDLSDSDLKGSIPAELGDLTNLNELLLDDNGLTGSIPAELGDMTNLGRLDLARNSLTGSIPTEMGDMTNLWGLNLSNNNLTGSIPSELGDLTSLVDLNLKYNSLTGSIPADLGDLTNLRDLNLSSNDLTGSIPADLGDLTNLRDLGLSSNSLTGSIPAELSKTDLRYLSLFNNGLTGSIPAELGDLTNLTHLGLDGNSLTGSIPAELGNLTKLKYLGLDGNGLTGSIPADLGNLTKLLKLNLNDNSLTRSIPTGLGNLTKLRELNLKSNGLTGSIPAELGNLTDLTRLRLDDNGLTGSIPAGLGNLTDLEWLVLDGNGLTGSIPAELGGLTNLKRLFLDGNGLTGSVPAELGRLAPPPQGKGKLEWFYFCENYLSGVLPVQLRSLPQLDTRLEAADHSRIETCSRPSFIDLSVSPDVVTEGDPVTAVTVTAAFRGGSGTSAEDVTVTVSVAGVTAGVTAVVEDFTEVADFDVTITAGQSSGTDTFDLAVVDDSFAEGSETVRVSGAAEGFIVSPAELTITDNDRTPSDTPPSGVPPPSASPPPSGEPSPPAASPAATSPPPDDPSPPAPGDPAPPTADPPLSDAPECQGRFCDEDGSVHQPNIERIAEWGITVGCETQRFCPEDKIARRQMAAFLYRAVTHRQGGSVPANPADPVPMTDVPAGVWYEVYARWAASNRIIPPVDGVFNPDGLVTRADMARMLVAAFPKLVEGEHLAGLFSDVAGLEESTVRAIEGLHRAGVTLGCDTAPLRYCPDRPVTRAQMASFFVRALNTITTP